MATKELAILIRAKDLASKTIGNVNKSLGGLGSTSRKVGAGLSTAMTRIGLAAGVALAGGVGAGVRSLADLARTQAQTQAVIDSTGGKAGVTAAQVRKYAEDLENLSTVDDKVIQDGQNMLLTFTNIGGDLFPRTAKATLNLASAMAKGDASQVDMKASAIQVGKALQDPIKGITALRRVGVAFTDQQQDQIKAMVKAGDLHGAQVMILKELETEFGNSAEAMGKGPIATWRRLQDVGEDLSQVLARALLPVLERAGTWLTTKLGDPAVIATLDKIGQTLGDAAGDMMTFIENTDFTAIGAGLSLAAGAAGTIVSAFMGMPEWVKIAVVSGWGLNKLTGGALGDVVGALGSGLIKGVLGMNAGVVNINAGVVNGGGGGPSIPPLAGPGGGLLATAAGIGAGAVAALVAAPLAVLGATKAITSITDPGGVRNDQGRIDSARARGVPEWNIRSGPANPAGPSMALSNALALAASERSTNRIVAAIHGIKPSVVTVTARTVTNNINRWQRVGNRPRSGPMID